MHAAHRDQRGTRNEPAGGALDGARVELVLACLVVGATFLLLPRFVIVPALLVPALAVYAVALLRRWSAGGRLGAFLLLLAVVGVAPTLLMMDASHTGSPTLAHDGGVIVTGQAVEELLAGNDPYTASYAGDLGGGVLVVDGLKLENPIRDHYPYSPGMFLLQLPIMTPMLALGLPPDARWLYLLVYAALGLGLARWSLRRRGDLVVPLLLLANPLFLPFLWQGETDVLLLAGLAGLALALGRHRPVAGALALGVALATKLLLAPFAVVLLVWLAARARSGRLERGTAVRAAAALALPCAVATAPFLLWHPGAIIEDVLLFHAGLAPRGTRSSVPGSRPCCSTSTSSTTVGRPRRPGPRSCRRSPSSPGPAPGCGGGPMSPPCSGLARPPRWARSISPGRSR